MLFYISLETYRRELTFVREPLSLQTVAGHISKHHGLRGMVVPTDFLKGSEIADLDRFRADNDKNGCPALVLHEVGGLRLASKDNAVADNAINRLERVLVAAQRLGCSSVGFSVEANNTEEYLDLAVKRLRQCATRAERLEINLLMNPYKGLTQTSKSVVDIIKKVGGFRLGVLPDFAAAAETDEPYAYMKMLAPYAPVVLASTFRFTPTGRHKPYDLKPMHEALSVIGFNAGVALVYRGEGDPDEGIKASYTYLSKALMPEEA